MDQVSRRTLLQYAAALPAAAGLDALAQALPSTFTLTTGFPAGGNGDLICRAIAEQLRGRYAENAVVENRTGAGGQIAIAAMKTRPNDGSVALNTVGSTLSIYPHTYKKLGYDPLKDLIPVSLACRFDGAFGVGPLVPAEVTSISEYLSWVSKNPVRATFGTGGAGSSVHLLGASLSLEAGVALTHVAYRGTLPAIQDLMGGQIGLAIGPLGEFLPHLKSERIRLLATSGPQRNKFAPTVKTLAEQGFPKLRAPDWYGIFLPAQTDEKLVDRLEKAVAGALKTSKVAESLAGIAMTPEPTSSRELKDILLADTEYWGAVVKTIGFSAES